MNLFAETLPLRSGWLSEKDDQLVYWETFGNATKPAILLHGGPGGGIKLRMPRLFDPEQRACSRIGSKGLWACEAACR